MWGIPRNIQKTSLTVSMRLIIVTGYNENETENEKRVIVTT